MTLMRPLAVVCLLAGGVTGLHAQEDNPAQPPATEEQSPQREGKPAREPYEGSRQIGFKNLPRNLASDQKKMWLFPKEALKKRHLIPVLATISFTAGLIATDSRSARYFRRTDTFNGFNSVFTSTGTAVATGVAPAVLYIAGRLGKNNYEQRTALLAAEALADAEVLTVVLKDIDRRKRPEDYGPNDSFTGSWGNRSGPVLHGIGSFPSSHATAAFAVASVFSRRYSHHRWVPYVAYGLSGLVSFSRLTTSAHFPSDVFMGGVLGYAIGRFGVVR